MEFWSTARSGRDFQPKSPCGFGESGIVSERATEVDATLDGGMLFGRPMLAV